MCTWRAEAYPPRELARSSWCAASTVRALARFRREVELLALLEHPGIARLTRRAKPTSAVCACSLALEYVQASDPARLRGRARPDLPARLRLLIAVCRARTTPTAAAWSTGDKPGNVLVGADGQPRCSISASPACVAKAVPA